MFLSLMLMSSVSRNFVLLVLAFTQFPGLTTSVFLNLNTNEKFNLRGSHVPPGLSEAPVCIDYIFIFFLPIPNATYPFVFGIYTCEKHFFSGGRS